MRENKTLKTIYFVFSLAVSLFSFGCDKVCNKATQDVAQIQNMTGRPLTVSFCKGKAYGEVSAEIPQDTYKNEISLGSRADSEVRGGPGASCSGVNDGKATMGVSLAPASFNLVKLCFNDTTNENLVIETNKSCPVNFLEQTSTAACR